MGTPISTVHYTYGDDQWGDLLTAYNGNTITYDTIGNPLTDGTWSYTWEHGRQLASMSSGSTTWNHSYDANGLRTQRTSGTKTYNYVYNGDKLSRMTVDGSTLSFTYDANGIPLTVTYNGTTCYYVTNILGDVIAILSPGGSTLVAYTYDAWGNILSLTGSIADSLGFYNPLRYRGYIYDQETGLYYLQSRYYNPKTGRFLNADAFAATGQGILGNNMFAYCNNNPIANVDESGEIPKAVEDKIVHDKVLAVISSKNSDLSWKDTCVYYNGENWLGGLGFCDLYNTKTGEVWELKKHSNSYSCTTAAAQMQLLNYTRGKLMHHKNLDLKLPYMTTIPSGTFEFTTPQAIYHVNYWYEGYGILRYSYTSKKTTMGKVVTVMETIAQAAAVAYYNAKAQEVGLPPIPAF